MSIFPTAELYILSIVLLLVMLRSVSNTTYRTMENIRLVWFLAGLLLYFCLDEFSVLLNEGILQLPQQLFWCRLSKLLSLYMLNFTVYLWIVYSECKENIRYASVKSRRQIFMPFLALMVLISGNWWNEFVFSFSKTLEFRRHFYFYADYILLMAALIIESMRKNYYASYEPDPVKESQSRRLGFFALPAIVFLILGMFIDSEPVNGIGMVIGALYIWITELDSEISVDPLTRINNRQQLNSYIRSKMNSHEGKLYLLMMDINHFKSINDKYGHLEGDRALVKLAEVLKEACRDIPRRTFLARYGGDEFILICEVDREEEIRDIQDNIHRRLRIMNNWADLPYTLEVCIGAQSYDDPNIVTPQQFVDAADSALYEAKKHRGPARI